MLTFTVTYDLDEPTVYKGFASYRGNQLIPIRGTRENEPSNSPAETWLVRVGEGDVWIVQCNQETNGFVSLRNYYRDQYDQTFLTCHKIQLDGAVQKLDVL